MATLTEQLAFSRTLFIPSVAVGMMILLASGCSPSSGLKLVHASGVITLRGIPLADAEIHFCPATGPLAAAQSDANGRFDLMTNGHRGAVPGSYRVTVMVRSQADATAVSREIQRVASPSQKSIIPKRYRSERTTSLTVEISDGKEEISLHLLD